MLQAGKVLSGLFTGARVRLRRDVMAPVAPGQGWAVLHGGYVRIDVGLLFEWFMAGMERVSRASY